MANIRHIHDKLAQLQDLTQVGVVVKPIGFDGSMLVRVTDTQNLHFLQMQEVGDFVFIGLHHHKPIPFQIQEVALQEQPFGFSLLFQLNGLDSEKSILPLKNLPVFAFIPPEVRSNRAVASLTDLKGFQLINKGESIGEITAVETLPGQFLGTVVNEQAASFDFPLHEDFIDQIDEKAQKLYVSLPEGIFDI